MHLYLKVKANSLAAEAKIIRKFEKKVLDKSRKYAKMGKDRSASYFLQQFHGLYKHRKTVVRNEARLTNIARGFLKGRKYSDIEYFAHSMPDWHRVEEMVLKYHENNPKHNESVESRFKDWKKAALTWYVNEEL